MNDRARLWFARNLASPLDGLTFGDWARLLRRERFRVDPSCWPRAMLITMASLSNSIDARRVTRKFGAAIEATDVKAPIFVLGHYRSGTTHLHNLLGVDPRLAAPSVFQVFNPHTFLVSEARLAPIAGALVIRKRLQDDVAVSVDAPMEDEVALANLTGLSPYLAWCFPRSPVDYGRYLTFRDADPAEVAAWSAALVWFLKAATLRLGGRPLVLKSPPHTARVRLILSLFPDTRFVHIRRDPYTVFASTQTLHRAVRPIMQLQTRGSHSDDAILSTYTTMYDAYFADLASIPPGRLVEVGFEDLERDPLGQLRAIYDGLGLPDFEEVRPALTGYLATIADYRKNSRPPLDGATKARVGEVWSRSFDAWGYTR